MSRSFAKSAVSIFLILLFNPLFSDASNETASLDDGEFNKIIKNEGQLDLSPLPKHLRASRYIAYYMKTNHYKKQGLNNHQSSIILDRYIETLDGNKAYFLASDIKEFENYRYRLDDAIYSGLVQPAFAIYRVFKQRWDERNQFALAVLKQPMDFTTQEIFEYDREDAAWPTSNEELDNYWRLRVKSDALNLVLAGKEMDKVKELLEKRYKASLRRVSQINSEDVFSYFMNAFTATVDPHSAYFSPRTAENFDIDMKLSLEGIGAVLETNDVYTKIRSIVTGGPADKSKQLAVDDKIIAVGQGNQVLVDVVGWRLDDVVDLIRGDAGSQVRLEIEPANASVNGKTKVISIIREKVKLEEQAAKSEVIKVGEADKKMVVGVIELSKFYIDFEAKNAGDPDYKSTTRDIRKLIAKMKKEDKIDAIIIDLRNNGGGSLGEAIGLTGLFIDQGPVVQEKRLQGRVLTLFDEDAGVAWDGPLAVLVNGASASASEIFAGAIQDYDRGLIIGEQTFGKGTVQNIIDLNYALRLEDHSAGVLKLTIDKFYRITGASTQLKGVMPDISYPDPISREHFGEASYDYALKWDTIKAVKYQSTNRVRSFIEFLNQMHLSRIKNDREFQYIIQDVEELQKRRQDTSVSLNIDERKKERAEDELKRLARENVRRTLVGKEPLKEIDEDTEFVDVDDAKLYETAHILSDLMQLKNQQKLAQNNNQKTGS
ncbi:MAG: carboxy terminal-processing peptidase [Enterobacterales bacterium]|nr:carboxy terminal-processing peptidase [Enterobacterales bacterium]